MIDDKKEKQIFFLYVITTFVLLGINFAACVYSDIKINELVGDNYSNLVAESAKRAISIILVNGWVTILVETLSWLVPKTNLKKVYGQLNSSLNKMICLSLGVFFHLFVFWNILSTICDVRKLLLVASNNLFQNIMSIF